MAVPLYNMQFLLQLINKDATFFCPKHVRKDNMTCVRALTFGTAYINFTQKNMDARLFDKVVF